jgi:hypothetical protein
VEQLHNSEVRVVMISLLYLSYSELPDDEADRQVQAIVDKSVANNGLIDVTGALIFTGEHFCQFLEGKAEDVMGLMSSIRLDHRHSDVTVVHKETANARRFASWSLAYTGRSTFISNHLEGVIYASTERDRENAAKSVIGMMQEFAR